MTSGGVTSGGAHNEAGDSAGEQSFDAHTFRHVMGQFCTGVTIIGTADAEQNPVGFACQSFAALSLDPPLVLFCPMKSSRTWSHIESSGTFAVSVLGHDQESVSAAFGRKIDDKFSGLEWSPSPLGNPTIDGSLAWIDCTLDNVLDGGDHLIAIGRVRTLGEVREGKPLLFYRGGYLSTDHPRLHAAKSLDSFLTWDAGAWL